MKQKSFCGSKITILVVVAIGLFFTSTAMAAWPTPVSIPNGSAGLRSRRAQLVQRSDKLLAEVNRQDAACKRVVAGSAQAQRCREWKDRLMGQIEQYYSDIEAFNKDAAQAKEELRDAVAERRSGGNTNASAQANAAAQSGEEAANATDAEGASASARNPFVEHNKSAPAIPAFEKSDPQIPDAMLKDPELGPKMEKLKASRTTHRQKSAEIQQKLEKLNSSNDPRGMQRSKLKEQGDSEKSQVDYANFSISEEIRKWQASKQEKSN